jgi:predicted small lipoprotein YifL
MRLPNRFRRQVFLLYSFEPLTHLMASTNCLLRRYYTLCAYAALGVLLSGCGQTGPAEKPPEAASALSAEPSTGSGAKQTAYRIRRDFDASLNAREGWAAALNTPASVLADHPFRIRFEVENPANNPGLQRYRLEYRRNPGDWKPLLAENFPQPAKNFSLDYTKQPDRPLDAHWSLEQGRVDNLRWIEEGHLRLEAGLDPLLTISRTNIHWAPIEFATILRFSPSQSSQASVVFAYEDSGNHRRADFNASGRVRIVHVEKGATSVFAEHAFDPVVDRFFECKLVVEDGVLIVEHDGVEAVVDESYALPANRPLAGIYLPSGASVDLKEFTIEGMPRSPSTSIIAAGSFAHAAATENLLAGSDLPFKSGAGISFSAATPGWIGSESHGEWEFPLVIRRFSDGAAMNEDGDRFEYRLTHETGQPLQANHQASVILKVPDGHLGGTFVETPMRLGPWQANDGSLYFLMEPAETWNALMAVKSEDGGRSWREMDAAHRPETGDLEGFASRLIDDQIHCLHQTSDEVVYHVFRTADHPQLPDTWAIRDEWLASPEEPPTQVADLAVRTDGSVVAVYGSGETIQYQIRSPEGGWGEPTLIDPRLTSKLSGPTVVLGPGDVVHLAYTSGDGSAWYRRILPDGSLTEPTRIASGLGTTSDDAGSILPLVYLEAMNEVSLLYRLATGQLWERRLTARGDWQPPIRVTSRSVVQNAVDSEQTGADVIPFGDSLQVLFIDSSSGQLYHTSRDNQKEWTQPNRVMDDTGIQWVRGALIKNQEGRLSYGYVIDAGADGGSGMNRYGEIPLQSD